MGLFRRKQEEEVEPTAIDNAAARMATAVKHIRALDSEVVSAFEEWRQAQIECMKEGIVIEMQMSPYFSSAFTAWHNGKNGHADEETSVSLPPLREAT